MKCPACGGAELQEDTRHLQHTYKGRTLTVRKLQGEHCPACGESVLSPKDGERFAREVAAFQAQVNAEYVDPHYIAQVRKKLALDQREAAALFGGGVNAFSRYETGKTKPPLALVKLLQLLDRHPNLMRELKAPTP